MATIRWCPIFPKWDSYQPLLPKLPTLEAAHLHEFRHILFEHRPAFDLDDRRIFGDDVPMRLGLFPKHQILNKFTPAPVRYLIPGFLQEPWVKNETELYGGASWDPWQVPPEAFQGPT